MLIFSWDTSAKFCVSTFCKQRDKTHINILRIQHFFSLAWCGIEVFPYICSILSAPVKNAVQTYIIHKLYKNNLL